MTTASPTAALSGREALRQALRVVVPNRIAVFVGMWMAMALWPPSPPSAGVALGDRPNADNLLIDGWFRWDAHWYWQIAKFGYRNVAQAGHHLDVQFFPAFPLLVRLFNLIIPDTYMAGMVAANVCMVLSAYLLFRLVAQHHGEEVARRALLWMLVYPWSFILSAMYTESLFLAAILGAFYLGEKERWWQAGLCAAVAGATRIVGFTAVVGLAVLYLEKKDWNLRRIRPDVLGIALSAVGPGGQMVFLAQRYGDPFAFIAANNEPGWGADRALSQIIPAVLACLQPSQLASGAAPVNRVMHFVAMLACAAGCLFCIRRSRVAYGAWGLAYLIASLRIWDGIGRFGVVVFPLYIMGAVVVEKPERQLGLTTLGCIMMGILMLQFSHWRFIG